MIDRNNAKFLLPLVNDPKSYDRLKLYANLRITALRNELEVCPDPRRIALIQGQIAELHRIESLQNEIRMAANG